MKKENLFTIILRLFSGNIYKKKQAKVSATGKENIWGISGRKSQMNRRVLMHLKPFTGSPKLANELGRK